MSTATNHAMDEGMLVRDLGVVPRLQVYKVLGGGLDASLLEYSQQTNPHRSSNSSSSNTNTDNEWSGIYTQFRTEHTLGTVSYRWEASRFSFTEAVLVRTTFENLPVVVLDGPLLHDRTVLGKIKAERIKQVLDIPATIPLMEGLGNRGQVALVRETAKEWECIFPHNLLPHLHITESTIVARFQKHPRFPITRRWCVAGKAWQAYENDNNGDTPILQLVPDLPLDWMETTTSMSASSAREKKVVDSLNSSRNNGDSASTFWAHPDANLIPLPSIDFNGTTTSTLQGRCIFLGPQQSARKAVLPDLLAAQITGIVNCTLMYPNHHQEEETGVEYCNVPVNDESSADLLLYMDGTTQFMHRHLANIIDHDDDDDDELLADPTRGNVLVHCQMGVSRSASMVVAYLIRYHGMTRVQALDWVKAHRSYANPNPGFWEQLAVFERRCRKVPNQAHESFAAVPTKRFDLEAVATEDWAKQSLARYQTLGHLLKNKREMFYEFDAIAAISQEDSKRIVYIALDFLYGRGILEKDLPWFRNLCWLLASKGDDLHPTQIVTSLLLDQDSAFAEAWSGEIYDRDVERIQVALNSVCD